MAASRSSRRIGPTPAVIDDWIVPLIVEAVGVMALCFIGIGAIMAFQNADPGNSANLVGIALAYGLAHGLMVAAAGHLSGGVHNPAVTLGLLIAGKLRPDKALAYLIAQLAGGVVGAVLIKACYPSAAVEVVNLGTPGVAENVAAVRAVIAEIVATFFLMYVVYGTAVDARGARTIAPLAIGLTVTIGALAIGPISGAAMNPARWFGPAVVQGTFDDWWVYWTGPLIGAAVAAILYAYIYLQRSDAGT